MQRYFIDKNYDHIELNNEQLHHITKVMRMNINDKIEAVFNSKCYLLNITSLSPFSFEIIETLTSNSELNVDITLLYCLPKGDKLDLVIQKATEIGVKNIIFSSSATVYGTPKRVPILESDPIGGTTNPYGTTKLIIEGILQDVYKVHPEMNIALLRYFNPIGAHESGLIGEAPNGIPNNLMPYITQVAVGQRDCLSIFGNDYPTIDGTGVRDYIHVVDLALGHVAAIKKLHENSGLVIYNLGTGKGTSVLELVHAFEEANNIKIKYKIVGRRLGDIAECYADCSKASRELNWKATKTIIDACRDSWRWQQYFSSQNK